MCDYFLAPQWFPAVEQRMFGEPRFADEYAIKTRRWKRSKTVLYLNPKPDSFLSWNTINLFCNYFKTVFVYANRAARVTWTCRVHTVNAISTCTFVGHRRYWSSYSNWAFIRNAQTPGASLSNESRTVPRKKLFTENKWDRYLNVNNILSSRGTRWTAHKM